MDFERDNVEGVFKKYQEELKAFNQEKTEKTEKILNLKAEYYIIEKFEEEYCKDRKIKIQEEIDLLMEKLTKVEDSIYLFTRIINSTNATLMNF